MIMKRERRKFRDSFVAILLAISMVVGLVPVNSITSYAKDKPTGNVKSESRAAFDKTTVSDAPTLETWKDVVENSTENIGRIWTDKTVSDKDIKLPVSSSGNDFNIDKGDSDFLVGLSALSSTSNISTVADKPLDMVFVLDVSGSMEEDISSYVYEPTYNVSTSRNNYYALVDGEYVKIDRITTGAWLPQFDHWELNGQEVTPKKSESDNGTQFYVREAKTQSRMAALTTAVNKFAEETAKRNDSITDETKQHRLSIVKFAGNSSNSIGNNTYREDGHTFNYSQIVTNLTAYDSSNISTFTRKVESLKPNGDTQADKGMDKAKTALQNAREEAQKVVVFFTDGSPNRYGGSQQDFDSSIANSAIRTAHTLKQDNTLVYSVGVFNGANNGEPNNSTSSENRYMHAISSNYPDATSYYLRNMGDRAPDSDYYKTAETSDELNKIFEDIFTDVNSGSGLPTKIENGYDAGKGGYITFTDELGNYMRVDKFKELVFADKIFHPKKPEGVEEKDGIFIYEYEGQVDGSDLYPDANLNKIIVQVEKSKDLRQGDKVTVKIPAGLIPLRHFNIDTKNDNTTMDIKEAYPMRIFYGVSLKPEVVTTLKDGLGNSDTDRELNAYLKDNRVDGNKAVFYSNFYNGENISGDKKLGNTIAKFTPSKANAFYFFTEDTVVYTDAKCTKPLKTDPDTSGNTSYYYKKSYFVKATDGTVEKKEEAVKFNGANFATSSTTWDKNDKGEVYMKAGAARLTRADDLSLSKGEGNPTGTATEIINPQWDNINNPQFVNVYLGNNGRMLMELPGALSITKDATVVPNKNLNESEVVKDKEFSFKITIPEMKNTTVKVQVKNQQGDAVGEVKDLSLDNNGTVTYALKDNETLTVYGLDAGTAYTVTEVKDSMPKGFTLTSVDGKTDATEATGNIVSGAEQKHTFVNTYDVNEVTVNADDFAKYEKHFANWDVEDAFDIVLERFSPTDAPMPEGSVGNTKTVTATEESPSGDFGNITFAKPDTYRYTIVEKKPADAMAGMTYSRASYRVIVTVADNGDGTLSAVSKMSQIASEIGQDMEAEVADKNAEFTNSFAANALKAGAIARKSYTDNSGSNPLTNGKFTFNIRPLQENAPAPEGV